MAVREVRAFLSFPMDHGSALLSFGDPGGRWHDIGVGKGAESVLGHAVRELAPLPVPPVPHQAAAVVGFAVLQAWSFVVSVLAQWLPCK